MGKDQKLLSYSKSGVNYKSLDYFKRLAQEKAKKTAKNLDQGKVLMESYGESAFVWEEEDSFRVLVIEGLGTKNLVADEMSKVTGKSYYKEIAQDTVAAIINDLIVVGAKPQVLNLYASTGDSNSWSANKERSETLAQGIFEACNKANVVWGGGETPGLSKVVEKDVIELAGSAVGIIKPKERLVLGDKLAPEDAIILIESSGIHANGISLARSIADKLPEKYATHLPDGSMFGETILAPSHIYSKFVQDLFEKGVEIHYLVHITGHGWRKIMRASKDFTYEINSIPEPQPVFKFLQAHSNFSDEEMYGTFNMGAGFAVFVPESFTQKVIEVAQKNNYKAWNAGVVKEGEKQVIIKPKNITYSAKTLGVR